MSHSCSLPAGGPCVGFASVDGQVPDLPNPNLNQQRLSGGSRSVATLPALTCRFNVGSDSVTLRSSRENSRRSRLHAQPLESGASDRATMCSMSPIDEVLISNLGARRSCHGVCKHQILDGQPESPCNNSHAATALTVAGATGGPWHRRDSLPTHVIRTGIGMQVSDSLEFAHCATGLQTDQFAEELAQIPKRSWSTMGSTRAQRIRVLRRRHQVYLATPHPEALIVP